MKKEFPVPAIETLQHYLYGAQPVTAVAIEATRSGGFAVVLASPEVLLAEAQKIIDADGDDSVTALLTYDATGFRVKGGSLMKLARFGDIGIGITKSKARELEVGSNGSRSDAMEALVEQLFRGHKATLWDREPSFAKNVYDVTNNGHNHRRGIKDLILHCLDGNDLVIEVKGKGGLLYYSRHAYHGSGK